LRIRCAARSDNPIEENSTMADPRIEVLTPQHSQIIFIDHQAADGARRAVDRSPGAEEQHGGAGQGGEGFRDPPPQWVRVVGGFTEHQFAEKRLPTIEELNAVARVTPAFVLHLYDRARNAAPAHRHV
jgi:hypothetical protein